MAIVRPFSALRPRPDLAAQVCELPYDVMSSEEARTIARGNPLSFLHVSKPEIDLPENADPHSEAVYSKGKENFARLISQGVLRADARPCFYLYRQVMGAHAQTGLAGVASCRDYLDGTIKRHELTRPDKEDDRVRHMEALDAQTGPVFLTYRAPKSLTEILDARIRETPDVDFVAADGVRHSSWVIDEAASIGRIETEFRGIPFLYIADGHHRSAAAARVFQARKGSGNSGHFLTVIFPHDQLNILPYNRVIRDLNGCGAPELMEKLSGVFIITEGGGNANRKHELGIYMEGAWHSLRFRSAFAASNDAVERLDVTLLQRHVLEPLFGIDDPRTSRRVSFVGGIRGIRELERLVDSGRYACAFSMHPTGIEDLMAISDKNGIMPPKSTWFEPKLRDGMFCHTL